MITNADPDDLECQNTENDPVPVVTMPELRIIISPEPTEDPQPFKVHGSVLSSLVTTTLLAYAARGVMSSFNPIVAGMGLNQIQKSILVTIPLIPTMINPIPFTWIVNQCGGKLEILMMVSVAALGMLLLSALAASTNLTSIVELDWRYVLLLIIGFLIGFGSAAFHLIGDALKWMPRLDAIPNTQLIYNFVVDSSNVTTPLVIFFLGQNGYFVPYILYTVLLIASAYSVLGFFHPSPYNQFKTQFDRATAKKLAIEYGQLKKLIGKRDSFSFTDVLRQNKTVLWDRRAIPLVFSMLTSLSSAWFTRLILPNVLVKGFSFTKTEAIITASIAYLIAILARPVAELMTRRWDKQSGGVKIHVLGSILTIISAFILTIDIPRWALYSMLGLFNIGYGFNLVTPLNIATAWSKPVNERLEPFNPSTMFNLFGTIGNLGSILLPLCLGLLVDEGGQEGFQKYYYIIMSMMIVSAISIPIIDFHVRNNGSMYANALTFFGRKNPINQMVQPEPEPRNVPLEVVLDKAAVL